MIQWNIKLKKLYSKALKTLIEQTSMQCIREQTSQKKAICIYILTLTKLISCLTQKSWYHVLHKKVALLIRRRSERGKRNRNQRISRKVWTIYRTYISSYIFNKKCWSKDEFFMTKMKLRLEFLFTDLSQHPRIYLVVFALTNFLFIGMGGDLKSSVS